MPQPSRDIISSFLKWGAGGPLPRYIQRSCARKFRRRNLGKTLRVQTDDGCLLDVVIGDNVDHEIALTGSFEPHLTRLIRELSSGATGGFLDVGCHLGYYSTLVKKTAPECSVTAVDANPVMARRCRANLEINAMEGRVINSGVGAQHAVLDFKTSMTSPSLGTFGTSPMKDHEVETLQVKVVPFAEILNDTPGDVFLLKMDVEGFEFPALSTLDAVMMRRIHNLVFEFSEERLAQCGHDRDDFLRLPWLADYEIRLIETDGTRRLLESIREVPDGDQNVWLRRR